MRFAFLPLAVSGAKTKVFEGGIDQVRQGLDSWRATGSMVNRTYYHALLAETYRKSGRPKEGLEVIQEELAAIETSGERWLESELYRVKGELMLILGENESEVESQFRKAVQIAQRQGAKSLELRATTSLSRLLAGQGQREEGRRMLLEIYAWFTEGLDTPDLQDAKALI